MQGQAQAKGAPRPRGGALGGEVAPLSPSVEAGASAELSAALRERRAEIEAAAMTRLYGVAAPPGSLDPQYMEGLRGAAAAALRYLAEGVDRERSRLPEVPAEVLVQSRLAARCGVPLDTVVRRCLAGHALFGDFLMEEVEAQGLESGSVKQLLRAQAALLDRLVSVVSEEYDREAKSRPVSAAGRRGELIERLLAGEPLDASELAYDMRGHHLGLLAGGKGCEQALRELARGLDRRLLLLGRTEGGDWAWLGGRDAPEPGRLAALLARLPETAKLAVGEPCRGLEGWRLTHRQAKAAWPIAMRCQEQVTRYGEVALLAAALQDDLLATSLRETYLAPLQAERDGGAAARETLRAYFAAQRNVSSAAHALAVDRKTVSARFRAIEQRIGRPLSACERELEIALELHLLSHPQLGDSSPLLPPQ